jgi:hypothetical protein
VTVIIMGKAKRKQKTKMGVDCVVQWKKKKKKKQILSKKKKREGDDEWGEGKEIEKYEVHSIKGKAPSQGTFFSNPSISISSFNSFCFFQNPLQI